MTLPVLYRTMDDLDELLLPYTVDLSLFSDISNPALLDHIRRVGVVFYQKTAETTPT